MFLVFNNSQINDLKSIALGIAITSADLMNRFAAMDTCINMIKDISDNELGITVASLLIQFKGTFVFNNIETSECHNSSIISAIKAVKKEIREQTSQDGWTEDNPW